MMRWCTIVLSAILVTQAEMQEVTVAQGSYRGLRMSTVTKYLDRFIEGIPYAKPPVGDLRYAKPQPLEQSTRTYDATIAGIKCLQLSSGYYQGSEDCLHLDIYVPRFSSSNQRKDVMVWFHGGGFLRGAATKHDGQNLATTGDVIVVAINYRLNIFGFLATGDSTLPGNYGLWDQRAAVQWIKSNIAAFGGDPDKITLFGESAGGRSIIFQMLSAHNGVGLFQRAITQSGSAMAVTFINREPIKVAEIVSELLGCEVGNRLLICLRSKSAQELIEASTNITRPMPFYPVVDGDFLSHDIGQLLADYRKYGKGEVSDKVGDFAKYELFSGWNDQEGLMYMGYLSNAHKTLTGTSDLDGGVSMEALHMALKAYPFYDYGGCDYVRDLVVDLLTDHYMTNLQPHISDGRSDAERRVEVYMKIAGDIGLKLPIIQHLQMYADLSDNAAFANEFTVKSKTKNYWYQGPDWLRAGADHYDDVQYVLGLGLSPQSVLSWIEEDRELSTLMMQQWTNFAKTGHPGDVYEPYTYPTNQTYTILKLGQLGEKKTMPYSDEERLWSALDAAIINTAHPTPCVSACKKNRGDLISGMLTMTTEEASMVMSRLLIILILICIAIGKLTVLRRAHIAEKLKYQ